MYQQETENLKTELAGVLTKIESLERQQNGGYTAQVAKSFHLGMVGGSGRNIHRLNRRRGAELDKTIDRAVILTGLYKQRDDLTRKIEYIESGKRDADIKKREDTNVLLVEYWKGLKAGDTLNVGNTNGNPIILKKSTKSVITTSGTKWTAAEIIGNKAAALI
jgi:hypothetical protein